MTIRLEPLDRTSISACDTRQGGGQNHLGSSSGVVQHLNSLSAGTSMMRVSTSSRSEAGGGGVMAFLRGPAVLCPKDGHLVGDPTSATNFCRCPVLLSASLAASRCFT